ncbi:MAG: MFS transporter [Planctomycetota bacterium]|nr:MFS transporter [Planctomycetota bacterium]
MNTTLTTNPLLRITVLCVLYCAQGIPHGFVTIALSVWFVAQGVDVEGIATLATAAVLPWSFKWAWGPVVDRYQIPNYGRRRPWILFAQTLMILSAGCLLTIEDPVAQVTTVASIVFVHNLFSGLQDVSVDALAVDLLAPEERGRANGLMYGSKYLGTSIGGAGLSAVLVKLGFDAAVLSMCGLLAAIMLVPLLVRERPGERLLPIGDRTSGHLVEAAGAVEERSANASFLTLVLRLIRSFGHVNTLLAVALAFLVWIPNGMTYPVGLVLFMNDLGWEQLEYSNLTGTWGIGAALLGSVGGGFIADRIGARKLAAIAVTVYAALFCVPGACPIVWLEQDWFASSWIVVTDLVQGTLSVSLFAIFMSVSWKIVAATQFTAYMALLNLSYSFGAMIAPPLETLGLTYWQVYLLAACIQITVVGILPFCRPTDSKRSSVEPLDPTPDLGDA